MWEPCEHLEDIEELVKNPELTYIDCLICGVSVLNENKAKDVCYDAGKQFSPLCYKLKMHEKAVYKLLLQSGNEPIPYQFEGMRAYAVREEELRIQTLHEESGAVPNTRSLNGRITRIATSPIGERIFITGAPDMTAELDGQVPDPPETVTSVNAAVPDDKSAPKDLSDNPDKLRDK